VLWTGFPELNVTASFMGEEMVRITFNGPATTRINTATGQVTSPEPFIPVVVRIPLLKTQALCNAYKTRMEALSLLGDGVVLPDATTFSPYNLTNCSIDNIEPVEFNGKNPGWVIDVGGSYIVNNNMW
jgi:hypothetical protein